MKFGEQDGLRRSVGSHPARGAWIEITCPFTALMWTQSHPARGAWIEIQAPRPEPDKRWSHPARGAWIEILRRDKALPFVPVAPRKGCVD